MILFFLDVLSGSEGEMRSVFKFGGSLLNRKPPVLFTAKTGKDEGFADCWMANLELNHQMIDQTNGDKHQLFLTGFYCLHVYCKHGYASLNINESDVVLDSH